MYEPLSIGVSAERAKEIEENSWENTWRLISDEEREEIFASKEIVAEKPISQHTPTVANGLTDTQAAFLKLVFEGRQAEAHHFTKDQVLSYITLGEEINEFFADTLGDVVLEMDGDDYIVVSDYEEEVRAAFTAVRE